MRIFNQIRRLFGKKVRPTLKQLPLDDLKREQLTIQNELRKLELENEKIERDEYQLKEEYKVAHTSSRDTLKRSIAQKLQNLLMRRKGVDTRLSYTSKMYQTITGMLIIKENMNFFEKLGVGSIISDMDLGELENYVAEATIEGTLQQEKLAAMLQGINTGVSDLGTASLDPGINDFMSELDAELFGETPQLNQSNKSGTGDMDNVLKTIDAVASKGINAARQMQQETNTTPPDHQKKREQENSP